MAQAPRTARAPAHRSSLAGVLLVLALPVLDAHLAAQDFPTTPAAGAHAAEHEPLAAGPGGDPAEAATPESQEMDRAVLPAAMQKTGRGPLLTALYASFLTLQVADVHSTIRALDRGARETNPLMGPFVDNRPAFVAFKLGTAAGAVFMVERLRRHNRVAAILAMVAIDSAYATVVAHNYRVGNRLGGTPR